MSLRKDLQALLQRYDLPPHALPALLDDLMNQIEQCVLDHDDGVYTCEDERRAALDRRLSGLAS